MKKRLTDDMRIEYIEIVDQTIANLKLLRCEYSEELWDSYVTDIENAIEQIEVLRGILDGSIH